MAQTSLSNLDQKEGIERVKNQLLSSPQGNRQPKVENDPHKIIEEERIEEESLRVPQIEREGPLQIMAAEIQLGKFDEGRHGSEHRRKQARGLQRVFASQRSFQKVAHDNKGPKTHANNEIYQLIHIDIRPPRNRAILALS